MFLKFGNKINVKTSKRDTIKKSNIINNGISPEMLESINQCFINALQSTKADIRYEIEQSENRQNLYIEQKFKEHKELIDRNTRNGDIRGDILLTYIKHNGVDQTIKNICIEKYKEIDKNEK